MIVFSWSLLKFKKTFSIDEDIESLFWVALLFVNAKTGTLGLALDINSAVNPLLVSTTMALASIF